MDRSARRWTGPWRDVIEMMRGAAVQSRPPVRRALCLVTALVLAGGGAHSARAQSEPTPDLQFTSPIKFHVPPAARLRPRGGESHRDWGNSHVERWKDRYFGSLTGEQSGEGSLVFAAEGQSGEVSTYCYESNCGPVQVGVSSGPEDGLLYLGVDIDAPRHSNSSVDTRKLRRIWNKFADFPQQRVELSVQAGQQKVYQEVRVAAPADAPDCHEYPVLNEDRYRCYYTRETAPAAFREPDSELVASLPGQLLQDREEYELVFAEEFAGSYTPWDMQPDNCDRGLAALDGSKWDYAQKRCRPTPQEAPCEYLENGHLHISQTSQCGGGLSSLNLFEPKYGYIEIRYTIGTTRAPDKPNYNVIIGNTARADFHLLDTHNLELNSLERLLTLASWVEIDFLEHSPRDRFVISHQYRNWGRPPIPTAQHDAVRPMLSYKIRYPCSTNPTYCQGERLTITEGMEWTPRGYLFLRRVHGREDELQIIPEHRTQVYESSGRDANGNWRIGFGGERRLLYGSPRDPYFVHLDPNDTVYTALYLEAVGVSHTPHNLSVGSWSDAAKPLTNESELTIDYIRVFQPRNRYADLEPLYQ